MSNRLVTFAFVLFSLILTGVTPVWSKEPVAMLPAITLKAGGQTIYAEVAATDETRQKGLMHREKLPGNTGMLFVFPDIAYHAMWMRNTPLPLAVAFMDQTGKIVSIHEMQPFTEISHQAAGPARYALEMNSGWFTRHKVKVGDSISGLGRAPKPN
ncbi:MAG: DUF192 domain-containing protein [Betaproteobacteria bacterium]